MREAIATELLTISEFSNRVYAAYTAPSNTTKPYCTYKLIEDSLSVNNMLGSFQGFQVFIYFPLGANPDSVVTKIKKAFNRVTLTIDDSPERYFTPEWTDTSQDFNDEVTKSLIKRIGFRIPKITLF
jgi:hypothetical protein